MKRLLALAAIIGAVIAAGSLAREPRRRLGAAFSARMRKRMEQVMANLPEGSPPKLVMSVLPQVRNQNEEIIRLLREQNELLRQRVHTTQ
jgi:ABC-type sugar transport system ATPase subunit